MPELLTMQDLANGHLDVKALGEAANGDENTIVTTRTGNTYPSAERAINIMFQNGGLPATPFATKALMTASPLVDGKYAMVTNDAVNNGLYVKTAGAWVKSAYDPTALANIYTDNKVKGVTNNFKTKALMTASGLANDSYAMVTDDTEANNGWYSKVAGVWVKSAYAPVTQEGMLAYIKSYKSEPNNIFDALVSILTTEPISPNLITPSTVLADGYLVNGTGNVATNAPYFHTADYIPVKEGETYVIASGATHVGTYYNSSKVRVGHIPPAATGGTPNYEFIIPAGASYMRVNLPLAPERHVLRKRNLAYKVPAPIPPSYWQGKKVAWYGTSIPAGQPHHNDRDNYSYANLAVHDLGGSILNKAVPGSGISKVATSSFVDTSKPVNYQNSMLDLIGTTNEPDLFVFDFGVNDYARNKAEIDGFNPSNPYPSDGSGTRIDGIDENTFIGAYNVVIKALLVAKPKAKICLLTHYSDDSSTESKRFESLNKVITGIAEHWSAPVLQVHKKINLINRNGVNSLLVAMPDGIHPADGDASTVECLRHIVRDFLVSIA